jgi:hypothetical protein
MRLPLRLLCLGVLPLTLAACKGEKKPAESRTAQGEILPGSASDAMLPLDTVRSQPPLAPMEVASGKPGRTSASGGAEAAAEPDAAATEAAAAAAPSAAPSAAAAAPAAH